MHFCPVYWQCIFELYFGHCILEFILLQCIFALYFSLFICALYFGTTLCLFCILLKCIFALYFGTVSWHCICSLYFVEVYFCLVFWLGTQPHNLIPSVTETNPSPCTLLYYFIIWCCCSLYLNSKSVSFGFLKAFELITANIKLGWFIFGIITSTFFFIGSEKYRVDPDL